jgi:N-acetylglucosamine-6-sulfatase
LLLVLLAFSLSFSTASAQDGSAEKPNIVLILADDLDYASAQQLPNTKSLIADRGAVFDNAFNSYPLCCPSRATILTGLYAHNHHVESNSTAQGGGWPRFRDEGHEQATIALKLQQNGYRTGLFGKYMNGYPEDDETYVPPGWDDWQAGLGELDYYEYDLNENGSVVHYGSSIQDYQTDVISNKTTQFIQDSAANGKPFFAYVSPHTPHAPATPAERHKDLFSKKRAPRPPSFNESYISDKPPHVLVNERLDDLQKNGIDERYRERLRSSMAVDDMVASIVRELKATGELENTYILFTSDNGWMQGEHRIKAGKKFPYEESVKTPLFVRGPGITPGSRINRLALNTDYARPSQSLRGSPSRLMDARSRPSCAGTPRAPGARPCSSSVLALVTPTRHLPTFSAYALNLTSISSTIRAARNSTT